MNQPVFSVRTHAQAEKGWRENAEIHFSRASRMRILEKYNLVHETIGDDGDNHMYIPIMVAIWSLHIQCTWNIYVTVLTCKH